MLNAVKKQIELTRDLPAPSRYERLVCCLNMLLSTTEENEAGIALLYQHVLENQSFQDVVSSDVFEAQWEPAKEVSKRVKYRQDAIPRLMEQVEHAWGMDNAQRIFQFGTKHSTLELWQRLINKKVSWMDVRSSVNRAMFLRLTVRGRGRSTLPRPAMTDVSKAIANPRQPEVSQQEASEHGFEFDEFGFLRLKSRAQTEPPTPQRPAKTVNPRDLNLTPTEEQASLQLLSGPTAPSDPPASDNELPASPPVERTEKEPSGPAASPETPAPGDELFTDPAIRANPGAVSSPRPSPTSPVGDVITTDSPVNLEHSDDEDLIVNPGGLVEAFELARETDCENHAEREQLADTIRTCLPLPDLPRQAVVTLAKRLKLRVSRVATSTLVQRLESLSKDFDDCLLREDGWFEESPSDGPTTGKTGSPSPGVGPSSQPNTSPQPYRPATFEQLQEYNSSTFPPPQLDVVQHASLSRILGSGSRANEYLSALQERYAAASEELARSFSENPTTPPQPPSMSGWTPVNKSVRFSARLNKRQRN